MTSKNTRLKLMLASIGTTFAIFMVIVLYLYIVDMVKYGNDGKELNGLISQQTIKKKNVVPKMEIITIKDNSKKSDIALKSKPKKQKKKPQQKHIKQQEQKQVIDKGRIGQATIKYAHKISGWIQRHMVMPKNLSKKTRVKVKFKINASGRIEYATIKQSSGDWAIDKLAINTIKSLSPLPAPPIEILQTSMVFVIPMVYDLK